jgi:hypothetical protein
VICVFEDQDTIGYADSSVPNAASLDKVQKRHGVVYLALHYPSLFTMTAPRAFLPGALRA